MLKRRSGKGVVTWLGAVTLVIWPASWYLIWLEIFRWRHMTKTAIHSG